VEARRRSWFDDRGIVIAGDAMRQRQLPFYAGAMHYWRVEPARWAACLRQIHDLGLTIVETCVPWRVHEPAAGQLVWDRERDLAQFLDAAHAAGLAVVLRPGPRVGAALTAFGLPDHVLADPACQARSASGSPVWMPSPPRAWPLPSYASSVFHERVHAWFAAVAEVVRDRLAPGGPVVAIGVDSQTQMFFRLGAYDHDYHADAIAAWREASGLDGEPPRAWDPSDAARCISWVRFKDQYVAHALAAFARMLDGVGLGGVARFHDLPPGHHGLYDLRGTQRAIGGPAGITSYAPRAQLRELRQRAIAAAGNADPIAIAFEVGIGHSPWLPPLDDGADPERERDQLLSLLACGIRGFNLVMAVERDRHYGAAIDRTGKLAPHAAWLATLITTLAEVDWPALRRVVAIAVVDTRADARFGHASCAIDPMTPVLAELVGLGPAGAVELGDDPAAVTQRRWQAALARALDLARVPYTLIDESVTEAELADNPAMRAIGAVIAPTQGRIDRGLAHTLRSLAEHKRVVVVIGPGQPDHDELGQPLVDGVPRRVGRLKAGSLDDLPGLAEDLAMLAHQPSDAWQVERPDDVHAYAHIDPAGTVRVVFVVSDAARPANAVVLVDDTTRALRDPFSRERIVPVTGKATIALAAGGVRMLVVER
jgi:beta-galactosidase